VVGSCAGHLRKKRSEKGRWLASLASGERRACGAPMQV
jgi:hypothetical protein